MLINVCGIDVQVNKKRIKNMHLYVKPPAGMVSVSAPEHISDKAVENFVRLNMGWVKKQREKFAGQPRMTERRYISGETYYLWGRQYFMEFRHYARNYLKFDGNKLILGMRASSSAEHRRRFVRREYSLLLAARLKKIVPKWEHITGICCKEYKTRQMTTKWGTCNASAGRIWINLQMAEKPPECLEYVVLHEIIHLKIRNHGQEFTAMLDKFMPSWRTIKNTLNSRMLESYFNRTHT